MTSLIKPNDSWRHNIPKKYISVAFLGHLSCSSLDKGKMESVYTVCINPVMTLHPCNTNIHPLTRPTVDGFHWMEVRVRG